MLTDRTAYRSFCRLSTSGYAGDRSAWLRKTNGHGSVGELVEPDSRRGRDSAATVRLEVKPRMIRSRCEVSAMSPPWSSLSWR